MAHSRYLRQMARSLRVEQQLTVDELAVRLSLPRSTIYYWVRDLPLRGRACGDLRQGESEEGEAAESAPSRTARGPTRRGGGTGPRGKPASRKITRAHSEAAYEEGLETFDELSAQPTFRDFVCIYLVQGEQRDRTRVALTNSDPAVMRLASRWIRRLTDKAPLLSLQYGPGQSLKELRRFWSETTGAEPQAIRLRSVSERDSSTRESDEQPVPGAPHGLLTVAVEDTLLRARLQGWMHRARESWR